MHLIASNLQELRANISRPLGAFGIAGDLVNIERVSGRGLRRIYDSPHTCHTGEFTLRQQVEKGRLIGDTLIFPRPALLPDHGERATFSYDLCIRFTDTLRGANQKSPAGLQFRRGYAKALWFRASSAKLDETLRHHEEEVWSILYTSALHWFQVPESLNRYSQYY
jgi:hypothetical protein